MADTQSAPQAPAAIQPIPALGGSITEAQEALLGLLEPEEEKPETQESAPTEDVEESTEETQDEPLEEVSEDESEEEESEEESEEDEVEEESDVYAVKVDGEELEVSLDELIKGYSRYSDYTRKTQKISEQRREVEELSNRYNSEVAQIQQERQQYIDGLQQAMQSSLSVLDEFSTIDWEHLGSTDPIAFVTKKDEYRDVQERIQRSQYEQQMASQKQQEEIARARQQALTHERSAIVEKIPEWGDPKKQAVLAQELKGYASEQGFSQEELASLIDHRSLVVLRKAMLYDKAHSSDIVKKKLKNKPTVIRAGSGGNKKASEKSKRAASMQRLRGTGHIDDASILLEDFIDI
jgi:hypothetical protein